MARIDPFTGELCVRIAYAGHAWAQFEDCVKALWARRPGYRPGSTARLVNGLYVAWLRPDGLRCRGRPVKIELVGMIDRTPEPDSAARIMLRDVSGIIHLTRGVVGELKQTLWYQDVVNRALAFWQYDRAQIPQVTQINGRYCSKCGQRFVHDSLISPLLNPWGAAELWSDPLSGAGIAEAYDACLDAALARAARYVAPPVLADPRPVAPDAMARRAFDLLDGAGQGALLPVAERKWLLDRAQVDAQSLVPPRCTHAGEVVAGGG